MKLSTFCGKLIVFLAVFSGVEVNSATADTSDKTYIRVNAPFNGLWGINGQNPNQGHHRVYCPPRASGVYKTTVSCSSMQSSGDRGDWALDFYSKRFNDLNPESVQLNMIGYGLSLPTRGYVFAVMPSCAAGQGGTTVFIRLNDKNYTGWVSFSHLDAVAVKIGQWIDSGTLIGRLKKWKKLLPCWNVSTIYGVHTHIEMSNVNNYSCYVDRSGPNEIETGTKSAIGRVGRTRYTKINEKC